MQQEKFQPFYQALITVNIPRVATAVSTKVYILVTVESSLSVWSELLPPSMLTAAVHYGPVWRSLNAFPIFSNPLSMLS